MIPASIIATMLQMPLADVEGYGRAIVHGRSGRPVVAGTRVLLVDDSCNKGAAFKRAAGLLPPKTRATRLAIFGSFQGVPDSVCAIWFESVQEPRVFAWNWATHLRLPRRSETRTFL